MRRTWVRELLVMAAAAAVVAPCGAAWAQDKAPAEEEQKAEEAKAKPLLPVAGVLTLGYGDLGLSGNQNTLRRYATPPRLLFIEELSLRSRTGWGSGQGGITLRGVGADDYYYRANADEMFGRLRADAFYSRSRYLPDTPEPQGESERKASGWSLAQRISPSFVIASSYTMEAQTQTFGVPRAAQYQRSRYLDVQAYGKAGRGFVSGGYSSTAFTDRTMVLPSATVEQATLSYIIQATPSVDAGGSYSRTLIRQAALPQATVETAGLMADAALGRFGDLSLDATSETIGNTAPATMAVTRNQGAAARLQKRWTNWNAEVGLRSREIMRLNETRDYVDVPRWVTLDGRLRGRLSRQTRITLKAGSQWLGGAPTAAQEDTRSLYWHRRSNVSARMETGPANATGYLAGSYKVQENAERYARSAASALQAGGTLQLGPKVVAFGEYAFESLKLRTEIADWPTSAMFGPDSQTAVAGLSWTVDPHMWVSATYTDWFVSNDNPLLLPEANIHGRELTLTLRRRFNDGSELGLLVAPLTYKDKVADTLDYRATIVRLSGSTTF